MSVSGRTWAVSGLCAVLALGFVTLGACNKASEKAKEKASEKMLETLIEKSTGKKADIDVGEGKMKFEADGTQTELDTKATVWPEDIPSLVPRFEKGKIRHAARSRSPEGLAWVVVFDEVPAESATAYHETLKAAGFEGMIHTAEDGGIVNVQKGDLVVTLVITGGHGQLSVQQQIQAATD